MYVYTKILCLCSAHYNNFRNLVILDNVVDNLAQSLDLALDHISGFQVFWWIAVHTNPARGSR